MKNSYLNAKKTQKKLFQKNSAQTMISGDTEDDKSGKNDWNWKKRKENYETFQWTATFLQ